jgi:hypothetical protein
MRWTAAFVLFVTALAAQMDRQPAVAVTAVRHWTQGSVVRIAIEVSGNFHFLSDRLHNPERLYFDLADTRPQLGDKPYWSETLADGYVVERVRLAQTTLTTTRVVLDLRGVADVSTVQLSNPNRLVIELRPAGSGAASFSAVAALRGPPNTIADPLRRFTWKPRLRRSRSNGCPAHRRSKGRSPPPPRCHLPKPPKPRAAPSMAIPRWCAPSG